MVKFPVFPMFGMVVVFGDVKIESQGSKIGKQEPKGN